MTLFDIILIVILGGFVLFGFWFGLIHTLGALVGTVVGAWAAGHYYDALALWLSGIIGGNLNVLRVIVFVVLFTIVNRLVGLLFFILEKVFKVLTIIPFLKTINRLAGAVLGLAEGVLVLGLSIYIASRYPLGEWFTGMVLARSSVARYLSGLADVLAPLLPEAVRTLRSLF
ncbi:MAG: CvpA family protein [Patescibacteria group bacterium]